MDRGACGAAFCAAGAPAPRPGTGRSVPATPGAARGGAGALWRDPPSERALSEVWGIFFFFPDENGQSLESFEERISLLVSRGTKLRMSFPMTPERANGSRSLKTGVSQRFPKKNQSSLLSPLLPLLFLPPPPLPTWAPFGPPWARCIWPLPGAGVGAGAGSRHCSLAKGRAGPRRRSLGPRGPSGRARRGDPRGERSGARSGPAASPFPRPGGQRGARLGRGCPG